MQTEQLILSSLKNLIEQYEDELLFLKEQNLNSFDTTMLPDVLQDMIRIANAKTPSFSNISALAVANFILSHMFGQVRPTLNDGVYSDDAIGRFEENYRSLSQGIKDRLDRKSVV